MLLEIATVTYLAGNFIYHRWIEDHPTQPLPPAATVPRADDGAPIPLVYGRCRVRTSILAWSGNYLVPGQTVTAGASGTYTLGGGGIDDPPAHYCFDGIFIVGVCFAGGSARLDRVFAGDTPITTSIGSVLGAQAAQRFQAGSASGITFTAPLSMQGVFYLGTPFHDVMDDTSAGTTHVSSNIFHDGIRYDSAANQNGHLSAKSSLGFAGETLANIPGFRNLITFFAHVALENDPSMPGIGVEVTATSPNSDADIAIGGSDWFGIDDADPAAVIYDVLTGFWGKLRLSPSIIDISSFKAASHTLAIEGNGYSRAIDQYTDAASIIQEVLKQTDGVLYQDPTSGLIRYALIRFDYNVTQLDDINPSNATTPSGGWISVQGWAEVPNQVRLTYAERNNNYNNATVIAQNVASITANAERPRSLSVNFPGVTNQTLATKIAARELAAVSHPQMKATVKVDRTFYQKRIGDVVTLTWPDYGIDHMVMRIARVNRGKPGASAITLDLLRDMFDVSLGAYPPA